MPGFYGVTMISCNPKLLFCGNRIAVMANGDPFVDRLAKNYGPGFGHAFKFAFDVAHNHIAAIKRYNPQAEPECVRWQQAEELARQVAIWFAGQEHPPIYVPGSRMLRAKDKRNSGYGWQSKHLELDGIVVLDIDQDIRYATPA